MMTRERVAKLEEAVAELKKSVKELQEQQLMLVRDPDRLYGKIHGKLDDIGSEVQRIARELSGRPRTP